MCATEETSTDAYAAGSTMAIVTTAAFCLFLVCAAIRLEKIDAMSLICYSSTPPIGEDESGATESPFSPDFTTRLDITITEPPHETTTSDTTVPIMIHTQTHTKTTTTYPVITTTPSVTTLPPSKTTTTLPTVTTTPSATTLPPSKTTTTLPTITTTPSVTTLPPSKTTTTTLPTNKTTPSATTLPPSKITTTHPVSIVPSAVTTTLPPATSTPTSNTSTHSVTGTTPTWTSPVTTSPCGNCPHIVSRAEWGAKAPKAIKAIVHPIPKVFIHHTVSASCTTQANCSRIVKQIQTDHQTDKIGKKKEKIKGWDDIGYNFLVGEDGNAYEGRGWDREGAHAKKWNPVALGIALIGNFTARVPNAAALNTVHQLIDCGVCKKKIAGNYTLHGHRDACPTSCPGNALYGIVIHWPHYGGNLGGKC